MSRRLTTLPSDVVDLLRREFGILTSSLARSAGLDAGRLRRLARAGLLVELARGCYTDAHQFDDMNAWDRHKIMARAFAISCDSDSYLTGWSAVVNLGLWTLGQPPDLPTVVRPRAPGRGPSVTAHGRILVAELPAAHRVTMKRWGMTSTGWTATNLARTAAVPRALVVADSALREGANLDEVLPLMRRWDGISRARWVVEHADGNSESVLETLGRFTCLEYDLPLPVPNAWVGADEPEKRLDGLWPYHHAAFEADGGLKYNDRPDAADVVRAQHEREFYLRRLGLDFARFGASETYPDRSRLADKFRALLRDNPPRAQPIRWWKHVPGVGPVEPEPEDWPSPHPRGIVLPAGWNRDLTGDGR